MKFSLLLLSCACAPLFCAAQSKANDDAKAAIADGNKAWIEGMKKGDAGPIVATYAADAVFCAPNGECIAGREAIEKRMKTRMDTGGRARSATVSSLGTARDGEFVYEWGSARAEMGNGQIIAGRYLTVWRHEPDGSWKIWRNVVLPLD